MIEKNQYIKWGAWGGTFIAIGLLLLSKSGNTVFHQLAWCYAWASAGASARGYLKLKEDNIRNNADSSNDKDFRIRYIVYLIALIFFGLLTFAILLSQKLPDTIFYLMSLATFFLMGFHIFMLENKLGI